MSWRDDAPAAKEEVQEPVDLTGPIVVNEKAGKRAEETNANVVEEELLTDKKEIKDDKKDCDDGSGRHWDCGRPPPNILKNKVCKLEKNFREI